MNDKRPPWDRYFMDLAILAATRSTCDRKHVGCVLVRGKAVIATGYNGSLPGQPHCDDVGHDLVKLADGKDNCVRTVHAEQNCIAQAAKMGVATEGAVAYVNTYPCWICAKTLRAAGVVDVIYEGNYNNDARVEIAINARKLG